MTTLTLNVEGMSCNHCKKAVEDAVSPVKGVNKVVATPEKNEVALEHDDTLDVQDVYEAIEDQGYDVIK